jgi:Tfp pilus assembly protein PilV
MIRDLRNSKFSRGFALVVTLSLMILLTIIAVGLLSLSSIALRQSGANSAQASARANAWLGLQLALAELQKNAGDDRRVTANGSIVTGAQQPEVMGIWKSWSPKLCKTPTASAPDYADSKKNNFVRWMVSGNEVDLTKPDWVTRPPPAVDQVKLFRQNSDGFLLQAAKVGVTARDGRGAFAWAVSQEATKAKLTVSGPEESQRVANDDLQAQPRPSLAVNSFFNQPVGAWNQRAAKVIDFNQVELDDSLWKDQTSIGGGAHFTAVGAGLLTNVVDGGLKTDMSLGFEMEDADFSAAQWTSRGESFTNPFNGNAEKEFSVPGPTYRGQRPLFKPVSDSGTYVYDREYPGYWKANVQFSFPVTAAPTFDSLRSFYRIPHHLYQSGGGLTVFERKSDHVAGSGAAPGSGYVQPPYKTMDGASTQSGIRPVVDRVMFLISGGLSSTNELRCVITPIITLWNPYNTALEIEGAVGYTWMNMQFAVKWKVFNGSSPNTDILKKNDWTLAHLMCARSPESSVKPYFCTAITADGNPLPNGVAAKPIRFEPGQVRVFAPALSTLKEFQAGSSIRDRTLFLRPVDDLSQFTTKGGFAVPMRNTAANWGWTRVLAPAEFAEISTWSGQDWLGDEPFYISFEDATRAKGSNPSDSDRGQVFADILANKFSNTGELVTEASAFKSPKVSYAQLKAQPVPIGVIESYHRVARQGPTAQVADLVFTGNPRQPWMNPFISNTTFKTGPQYQVRMRAVSSFNQVMESSPDGKSAYYGATQSATGGRTHLSFFEIPSAPMLSLAGFQHADLSMTSFAPANQFGNSWASAYVPREKVQGSGTVPPVDYAYVLNEALWDGWFFSGAAPTLTHSSRSGDATVWNQPVAGISLPLTGVLRDFMDDPLAKPLRNPRMVPSRITADKDDLAAMLSEPAGCLKIAAELMVDGAFNVNSTSVEAWTSMLAGLRGARFDVGNTPAGGGADTAFPRLRDPLGTGNDVWHGYRTLSDDQIKTLAGKMVEQVVKRGPFLSLGEFVNRRVSSDDLGLKGALQTAIDDSKLNDSAMQSDFDVSSYHSSAQPNIVPNNTGVGVPGYLTQADVLKPLSPVITVRSDTFTIRSYGEAQDTSGKTVATAWAEAVVQRVPDFLDSSDEAFTPVNDLNPVNAKFGRKFKIVSFRFLPSAEAML